MRLSAAAQESRESLTSDIGVALQIVTDELLVFTVGGCVSDPYAVVRETLSMQIAKVYLEQYVLAYAAMLTAIGVIGPKGKIRANPIAKHEAERLVDAYNEYAFIWQNRPSVDGRRNAMCEWAHQTFAANSKWRLVLDSGQVFTWRAAPVPVREVRLHALVQPAEPVAGLLVDKGENLQSKDGAQATVLPAAILFRHYRAGQLRTVK